MVGVALSTFRDRRSRAFAVRAAILMDGNGRASTYPTAPPHRAPKPFRTPDYRVRLPPVTLQIYYLRLSRYATSSVVVLPLLFYDNTSPTAYADCSLLSRREASASGSIMRGAPTSEEQQLFICSGKIVRISGLFLRNDG
ncbi:hypothetical protein QE152_g885 [Popillia japonica]|uniref:Uncharacterized protein n=1 Tax=Popillia japonica TaxID=7064 RepID=A0AAW1N4T8_POPJA